MSMFEYYCTNEDAYAYTKKENNGRIIYSNNIKRLHLDKYKIEKEPIKHETN